MMERCPSSDITDPDALRAIEWDIVNLFAGPGGWSEGINPLGLRELGLEWDEAAATTARAAGHPRLVGDVAKQNPLDFKLSAAGGLIGSPPCFVAGTPVLTRRGSVAIEDVVLGDEVWTHENRWRPVTDVMSREADTVRVGPIRCTPDHPFWVRRQMRRVVPKGSRRYAGETDRHLTSEAEWVPAQDVFGTYTATPVAVDGGHGSWPCDPWLAGRYVADGWTGRDGVMLAIGDGREVPDGTWTISRSGEHCRRFTRADHVLAEALAAEFGSGAENKTFPVWVLSAPEAERRRFLEGYQSGDGNVHENGSVRFATVSANLASMLLLLGTGLGYSANVTPIKTSPTKQIEGRTVNQRAWFQVAFLAPDGRFNYTEDGFQWRRVTKRVTPLDRATVYDITVADDHSFLAWGKVVHNCQGWSTMGQGKSRQDGQHLLAALERLAANPTAEAVDAEIAALHESMTDDRSVLVLEPLRWLLHLRPAWTTWEQVPNVLVVWEACRPVLEAAGYSVDTGVMSAEQYGVPQTRRRAYLVARRADLTAKLGPATLAAPTHSKFYPRTPDKTDPNLPAPVTMGDALRGAQHARYARGAAGTAFYVPEFNDQSGTPFDERWIDKRPATAVAGRGLVQNPGANANRFNGSTKSRNDGVKVEAWQAGVLQSFREDYPWSGNQTEQFRQAGDVVCPLVAYALVNTIANADTRPHTPNVSALPLTPAPTSQGAFDLEGIA